MTESPYFVNLKNRGKIIISGSDNKLFLQSLVSNDIELLNSQPCVYSCLLTPQGKFLYDFFITEASGALHLDCEGGERAIALGKLLKIYRLRANVDIEIIEDNPTYAVFPAKAGILPNIYKDPRSPDIGYRSYERPDLPEKDFEHWDRLRISLCIPDGSRDMIEGKSTLLECNIDKLNGLSYDKGCYIGQELTARMHYRGLAKKHLRVVTTNKELLFLRKQESSPALKDPCIRRENILLNSFPAFGEPIMKDSKTIGEMRSFCGDIGLALLKN